MNTITLHRDDLEAILKLVDEINPTDGNVTIKETRHSGIGSIVEVEIPYAINGHAGTFVKEIIGVDRW